MSLHVITYNSKTYKIRKRYKIIELNRPLRSSDACLALPNCVCSSLSSGQLVALRVFAGNRLHAHPVTILDGEHNNG